MDADPSDSFLVHDHGVGGRELKLVNFLDHFPHYVELIMYHIEPINRLGF